ncbi:MAG: NAD-dependent epimerase/dehydratase family protein [Polyangiales bacterium]
MEEKLKRAVVLGGSGFVGRRMVEMLASEPHPSWPVFDEIVSADIAPFEGPLPDRVRSRWCDVRSKDSLRATLDGAHTVFHLASVVHVGLSKSPHIEAVNVDGTRNVIDVCRALGVPHLVYTSSEDVVLDREPVADGDESIPYPAEPIHDYVRTKIQAEKLALAAHGADLAVCAVRPTHVYGPHDPHAIPESLRQFAQGTMPMVIGDPSARFDCVYVDNVVHAHVLAAARLHDPATRDAVGGRAYFVSEGYAPNFFDFLVPFAEAKGLRVPQRRLPKRVAFALADLFALAHRATGFEPPFHRFHLYVIGQDFFFNAKRAERELGYAPIVSTKQGIERTLEWVRDLDLR